MNNQPQPPKRSEEAHDRWANREITPAERARLDRFAGFMALYNDVRNAWAEGVSEECNIDVANGELDSRATSEIEDYKSRFAKPPTFQDFLRQNKQMLRNDNLWFNSDTRWTENPYDDESGLRWDAKNKTWWTDDGADFPDDEA
ncbi:MAG: hypothetical protein WAW91_00160 [Candidatus Nanoperiomorbaceae bacterium]